MPCSNGLINRNDPSFSERPVITEQTIQAYRETEYRVHGDSPFTLKVGHPSPELLQVMQKHKVDRCAFITAFNPYSASTDAADNASRQLSLSEELSRRSLRFIEGIGQHPSNQWPGEDSFLVFGIRLEAAKTLGRRFEQNAILWCDATAIPQLILLDR